MQISTRGRYAVMAMVDLAHCQSIDNNCGPVCLAEISTRQQLSQSYLEQLFGKLRRADLVCSARGPGGGYQLARSPDTIAIADIVAAVDEPIKATRCTIGSGGCLAAPVADGGDQPNVTKPASVAGTKCQTHDLWRELGRQITAFLSGVTLADVVLGEFAGHSVNLPTKAGHDRDFSR